MTPRISFDERVAIITGAGRGIGQAYAELLAERGARVVVNDTGGSMTGDGSDASAADETVRKIRADGGLAEANRSDVATERGARELVANAMDSYGRVDIVINNAGIYTMDSFPDLELEVLRRHFDVHVGGSFNVTRAAWPHLIAAKSGRVVMTTSSAVLGAENLVAYGQAKGAVLALGRAIAQVGRQSGIKVNMVAPLGMTRMMSAGAGVTGEIPTDPTMSPALVAPLVAILCHESCPTIGETYLSGLRHISRVYTSENEGYTHPDVGLTPEHVLERWSDIAREDPHFVPTSTADEVEHMGRFIDAVKVIGEVAQQSAGSV